MRSTILISIILLLSTLALNGKKNQLISENEIRIAKTITSDDHKFEIATIYKENSKTIDNKVVIYSLPDKELIAGAIELNGSLKRAFVLKDPDKLYILSQPSMSYPTMIDVSINNNEITRSFNALTIISINKDKGWIAYNEHLVGVHSLNPGDDPDAFYLYNVEDMPPRDPPPMGAFVYLTSTDSVKPLFIAKASSVLMENKKKPDLLGPSKIIDGYLSTAWSEGITGDGVEQWVELIPIVPVSINAIMVWGSYGKSTELMKDNDAPSKLQVMINNKNSGEIIFGSSSPYFGSWQYDKDRKNKIEVSNIRLIITEIKQGTKWDDCCISEIEVR